MAIPPLRNGDGRNERWQGTKTADCAPLGIPSSSHVGTSGWGHSSTPYNIIKNCTRKERKELSRGYDICTKMNAYNIVPGV